MVEREEEMARRQPEGGEWQREVVVEVNFLACHKVFFLMQG